MLQNTNDYERFAVRLWSHSMQQMIYEPFTFNVGHAITTDSFIAMQCTGMKDRNGKLIWEGDILAYNKIPEGELYHMCGFWCLNGHIVTENADGDPLGYLASQLEIVGNSYEEANRCNFRLIKPRRTL